MFLQVFEDNRDFFFQAAISAAGELGLFDALARQSRSAETLASSHDLSLHRLAALTDVLCAEGVLTRRSSGRLEVVSVPVAEGLPQTGWGLLAEAISADNAQASGRFLGDYHGSLADRGETSASELAAVLSGFGASLLDLGCGAGHHTAAFLDRDPGNVATVMDVPEVISLTRVRLEHFGDRVHFHEGDARSVAVRGAHDVALVSQLLHWHDSAGAEAILATAYGAVRPGGSVVVVEVDPASDRSGPLPALYFNLNLALYAERGAVHDSEQIRGWMEAVGLEDIDVQRPAWDPGLVTLRGVKP